VVAKLDRLSRSLLDFAAVKATAQKHHWALVALDCAVDTSTRSGEAMAHVLATFGQFERRLIGQRTKEALAAKKASGVRLGRPPTVPQAVVRRMQRQRARGDSLRKIATRAERWWRSTARSIRRCLRPMGLSAFGHALAWLTPGPGPDGRGHCFVWLQSGRSRPFFVVADRRAVCGGRDEPGIVRGTCEFGAARQESRVSSFG
jgi:hypothetical protein